MVDYYNLLGIPPDASPEAVRRAFRARAKAVHPDAHPQGSAAEREALKRRFIQLAQAYETLNDPRRRAVYDRQWRAAQAARRRGAGTGWRSTQASFGRARRQAAEEARAAEAGADEGLDDLLRDVESLLGRFGLNLRQPFEELLEALLDWARGVFRQVMEAWEAGDGSGRGSEGGGAAGGSHEVPGAGQAAGGQARQESPSEGARRRAARPDAAAEAAALQAELDALKGRVRRRGPAAGAGAPSVEEELRRLKRRLGKGG